MQYCIKQPVVYLWPSKKTAYNLVTEERNGFFYDFRDFIQGFSLREASVHYFVFTTGLPKAAVISHLQILKGAAGLWAFGATSEDIIYITLPLYHSAASLLGIGGCIELGKACLILLLIEN